MRLFSKLHYNQNRYYVPGIPDAAHCNLQIDVFSSFVSFAFFVCAIRDCRFVFQSFVFFRILFLNGLFCIIVFAANPQPKEKEDGTTDFTDCTDLGKRRRKRRDILCHGLTRRSVAATKEETKEEETLGSRISRQKLKKMQWSSTARRSRNQKEEKDSPRRHKGAKKERKQQKEKEA
jgi:hypothetical protein